jgi:hypothetical protein
MNKVQRRNSRLIIFFRETGLENMYAPNDLDCVAWLEVSGAIARKGPPVLFNCARKPVVEEGIRGIDIQIPKRDRQQTLKQP